MSNWRPRCTGKWPCSSNPPAVTGNQPLDALSLLGQFQITTGVRPPAVTLWMSDDEQSGDRDVLAVQ
jgi:hypothetical protein